MEDCTQEYEELCEKEPKIKDLLEKDDYLSLRTNMFAKSDIWRYENEYRIVFFNPPHISNQDPRSIALQSLINQNSQTPYLKPIELICGYNVDTKLIPILKNSTTLEIAFRRAVPKGGTYQHYLEIL